MKIVNGTSYHDDTDDSLIAILERVRQERVRVVLRYGNRDNPDWGEEYGVSGYIGRSAGKLKVPILVFSKKSIGGPSILDHCITRICTTSGKKLYQSPHYKAPVFEIGPPYNEGYASSVSMNGKLHAQFRTEKSARRWIKKMKKWCGDD